MKYKYNNEWKDLTVKAGDTLPIGTIVDYDGDTVPTGYEEVENTILRKELTANASGTISINWQNLGSLYLDLTPGTWFVKANANFTTTGSGRCYNKSCLSFDSTGGSVYTRLDSMSSLHPNESGVTQGDTHSLSCIVTVDEVKRIYLLEAYAYTGTNTSITLNYDTNKEAGGPSFIEARKLD